MRRIFDENPETSKRPSSRMTARLVAEMQLGAIVDVVSALEEHLGHAVPFDRALFLLMILRGHSRFRASSTGTATHATPLAPTSAGDGISVNAVAQSLGRPFETVRRHINELVADGVCVRIATGIVARDETLALPAFVTALRMVHDRMVGFIADLQDFGVMLPATRPEGRYDADATIAAAIDLMLTPFEYLAGHYDSWLQFAVINGVVIAAARGVTFDPVLARQYGEADTVPPEELRRAVSISALARALRMSYSTVRREAVAAIDSGKIARVPGGLRTTTAFLSDAVIAQGSAITAMRVAQVLNRLGPGGFRFDDPKRCYLGGRPAVVSFD